MATSDIATPYFEGSMVALVTPMFPDGRLDFESYKNLIDWHVQEGTKAVVVVGTTGESPSVNMDEHAELIEVAVKHAGDRIPVIAGVGGNSTSERSEEHTSELQSRGHLVCRLLLEKKKYNKKP